jgi:hypothetical protein
MIEKISNKETYFLGLRKVKNVTQGENKKAIQNYNGECLY